jgi:hypothetical protein
MLRTVLVGLSNSSAFPKPKDLDVLIEVQGFAQGPLSTEFQEHHPSVG